MPVSRDMPESCMSTCFSEVFLLQPAPLERRLHRRVDDREHRNRSLMSSGLRPIAAALRAHLLAILLHAPRRRLPSVMMVSAHFDANFLPAGRAAGLHDRHSSLGRAGRVDRPAHLEVLAHRD